jgi:predicted Ser/Thr protein kinase
MSNYLLQTTEKGFVTVANQLVELDIVFAATVNELHLESFKQIGEFASFQGRMTFVRVPYIRHIGSETRIYRRICDELGRSHVVAPHVPEALALFAVLSRLHRPDPDDFDDVSDGLVENLTPLEKAWLYAEGRVPDRLSPAEGRELLRLLPRLRDEYADADAYEGRYGASVRDLRATLLRVAARNKEFIGPGELIEELADMVRDRSVYAFLQLEPEGEYHDPDVMLESTRSQLGEWILEDVQASLALVPESEYVRQFDVYFRHLVALARGERVTDPATGEGRPADEKFMASVERHFPIAGKIEEYRRSLMSRLASYAVEHRGTQPVLKDVFPDLFRALRTRFHHSRREAVLQVVRNLLLSGRPDFDALEPQHRMQADLTAANLLERGYRGGTLRDALAFVLDHLDQRT